MRRFICATLLISLCLQSTGAAAVGPSGTASINATLAQGRLDFQSAANWLLQTPVIALITAPERYAAMHAPPPARPPHTMPKFTPADFKNTVRERPANWRSGTRGVAPPLPERPILPKDSKKAPPLGTGSASTSVTRALTTPLSAILRAPVATAPHPIQPPHIGPPRRTSFSVTLGNANNTGINPWWTYEEGAIPGVGKYMVNVANGNLIVQSNDVVIPERGVELAFRRTYNSMSGRDWNADDGSPTPGQFGDGWTNTFDTHLAVNSSAGISVFDSDGARYDYTPSGSGCLTPSAGVHDTLCWDGGCGYFWTKKSGTVYHYWEPSFGPGCEYWANSASAYAGRLYMISARNNNNWIRLDYSWAGGDATRSANLTQISATHQDGQTLTLNFAVASSGADLLSSLVRPDGVTITYAYDASNDLTAVTEPSNGSANSMHAYGWYSGHQMSGAAGPRWTVDWASDGGYVSFGYSGPLLQYVWHSGVMNFTPPDGNGIPLQSGPPTSLWTFAADTFVYNSGSTTFGDWDGHGTIWYFDAAGRTTQTQQWTGSLWLTSYASWDSSNNLTETVDARGNATDFAYDTNGNQTAVARPAISTSQGTFRPTTLYSYDRTNNANNVTSICDSVRSHAIGQDWTGNPGTSDTLCPNQSGAARYSWDYSDGVEPFGRMTASYAPAGYHHTYSYEAAMQGGDFGLLTSYTGDCVSQIDGTNRCPSQTFSYDSVGNRISYATGNGTWTRSYNSMNLNTSTADPDGVTARVCYYPNGQISAKQSALQYQMDGSSTCGSHSVAFTYDPDENLKTEVHHFGNVAGTTAKWYDGADRLVEVQLPQDAQDVYQKAWTTRYIYDLSQGGTVSFTSGSTHYYSAHGNLFKTQELLAADSSWYSGQPRINNNTFEDTKGVAFDAADRPTHKYAPEESFSYDTSAGTYGELAQHCNALNACGSYTYDAASETTQISYNDTSTPSESIAYDPDGRIVSMNSSSFGTQTYSFDTDGREMQSVEPSGGGATSPATLTYHYYSDGLRSAIDVSSSGLTQTNLFTYSYRPDAKVQQEQINLSSNALVGNSSLSFTYSNAGRPQHRTESGPAANASGTTISYDINGGSNTGTVSGLNYPSATISGVSYDAEGELTGYQESTANVGTKTQSFAYTTRGEQESDSRDGTSTGNFANGTPIAGTGTQNAISWNPTTGAIAGSYNPTNSETGSSTNFAYDAAGRQTTRTDETYDRFGSPHDYSSTRQYDAENRTISGSQQQQGIGITGTYNTLTAYKWGPNGHPILVGSTPTVSNAAPSTSQLAYDTLHWDGDQLLFTTNAQGQVDDIKLGAGGDITPLDPGYAGLTFWDRIAGSIGFCHNATGAAGNDMGPAKKNTSSSCTVFSGQSMQLPSTILWSGSAGLAGGAGQGKLLGMPGTDGLSDGTGMLQGVRVYDPHQGGWTSPDAYPAIPGKPITQKGYAWDGNNPISFSDPSGYDNCPNVLMPAQGSPAPKDQYLSCQPLGLNVIALVTLGISAFFGETFGVALAALGFLGLSEPPLPPGSYVGVTHYLPSAPGAVAGITYIYYVAAQNGKLPSFFQETKTFTDGHKETLTVYDHNARPAQYNYQPGPGGGRPWSVSLFQLDAELGAYDSGGLDMSSAGGTTIMGGYNNENVAW